VSRVVRGTRTPTPGSSPRDPPMRAVDRTARITVGQRPCTLRVRGAPSTGCQPRPFRSLACSPALPFLAAPCASLVLCPRSQEEARGSNLEDARLKGCRWARLFQVFRDEPALLGFCPSSRCSRIRDCSGAGLALFGPGGPTSGSPRARRPVTGAPATPLDAVRFPPDRLPGQPRESPRFGGRTRNRSALDPLGARSL